MTEPLSVAGGTVTDWDDQVIEFTGPNGIVRMARAAAPPQIQQQVTQAEQAGAVSPRAQAATGTGQTNAFGVELGGPAGVPMGGRPQGVPPAPQQGAAGGAGPAAATPPTQQIDPLQPINDRLNYLRSQPQVQRGGGGTRTATSVTAPDPAGVEAAKELQTDVDIAAEGGAMAREDAASVESDAEKRLGELAGEQASDFERVQGENATDHQRYQESLAGETTKLQQLQEAARTEVDPGRWWREKSTGKKILAGMGVAIGGYAAGLRGDGKNSALAMIQQAIDADVQAQQSNRDAKRRDAADQQGFMSVLQGQYADRAQERQAGLILGQQLVAAQAERIGHQARSETVKQRAFEVSAQLRENALRQRQQFLIQSAGQRTTQTQQVGGGLAPTQAALEAAALEKQTYVDFDPAAMIPAAERYTGVPMQALAGKDDAKDINKQMGAIETMMSKIQRLKSMGRSIDKNTANSLYSSLIIDGKNVDQAGALDLGTEKIMREVLGPNPSNFFRMSTALPSLETTLRGRIATELRNRAGRVNPGSVPVALRARFAPVAGGTTANAAPRTQPLAQDPPTEDLQ